MSVENIPSRDDLLAIVQAGTNNVLGEEAPTLTLGATLSDDAIGIDSLDLIEIVMEVEESLGLSFESAEFDGVETVEHLVELIEAKIRRTSPSR